MPSPWITVRASTNFIIRHRGDQTSRRRGLGLAIVSRAAARDALTLGRIEDCRSPILRTRGSPNGHGRL